MTPLPDEAQIATLAAASAAPLVTEAPALSVTAAPAMAQPVPLVAAAPKPKRNAPIYDEVVLATAENPVGLANSEVVTRVSPRAGGVGV